MRRRREVLAALLACALAPRIATSARERVFVIGYLSGGAQPKDFITAPLAELGYAEGKNLRFEVRKPSNWEPETLAGAARELVATKPDVLIALMAWRVHALAAATRTIPIVSLGTADPLGEGLVQSLRRPGGNVTGLSLGLRESAEATVRLLRRMRPSLRRAAMLYAVEPRPAFFEPAVRAAGLEPVYLRMGDAGEAERVLRPLAGEAAFIAPTTDDAAARRYNAVAHGLKIAVVGSGPGALMSYGFEFADPTRRAAAIIDKVLRGGNPAEIPLELPDRPSFMLNRKVASEIGIDIPNDVLLRVTELVD